MGWCDLANRGRSAHCADVAGPGSMTPFAGEAPRRSRSVELPKSSGLVMKGFMIAVMNPMNRCYMRFPRSAIPDLHASRCKTCTAVMNPFMAAS